MAMGRTLAALLCLCALTAPLDAAKRHPTMYPRSEKMKQIFRVWSGYPKGRPGYVIDHIIPLACGGLDSPHNMTWQTIEEAKQKDTTERLDCESYFRETPEQTRARLKRQ